MDDARTKATLDALADLFLTGPAVSSSSPASARPAGEPTTNPFTRHGATTDELSGPRPIRMPPKLRPFPPSQPVAVNPPEPVATPRDPEPSPAIVTRQPLRLRRPEPVPLTEQSPDTPPEVTDTTSRPEPALASPGPIELHVEAVFLANLPGFGGPWLTQYAHRLAQRRGPVVVLHVDPQQIDIDLVTSNKPPLPQDIGFADVDAEAALDRWIDAAGVRPLPTLLRGLIEEAPVAAATWLIHFPGEIDQNVRALAAKFDRWRVLCGADELAVSSAQQLLKQLLEPDAADAAGGRGPRRQIGLMIFGADEARSLQVADRLTALSQEFLRGPIGLAGWQKQMVPVNLRTLGSYLGTDQVWPAVWSLIESHGGVAAAGPTPQAAPPAEEEVAPAEEIISAAPPFQSIVVTEPEETPAELSDEALVEEELSAFEAAQMAKARAKAAFRPAPVPAPVPDLAEEEPDAPEVAALFTKPAPAPEATRTQPKTKSSANMRPSVAPAAPPPRPLPEPTIQPQPVSSGEPDLSSFLPAGCVPLAARRPRHSKTQLALDEHGVIHLLHRHVPTNTDAAADDGLRAAVVDLIETRAWVREHFKLLTMTQRQLRFDRRAKPVLHLFTDQAKLATALTGRLGQFVRFHLLQRVRVGSESTWFSTELN